MQQVAVIFTSFRDISIFPTSYTKRYPCNLERLEFVQGWPTGPGSE